MKKRLLTTWLMLLTSVFAITMMAQTVTVQVETAGGLGEALQAQGVNDPSTIKSLKVTGKMGTKDWTFVKNNMPDLEELDISETNLKTIPESALQYHPGITLVHLPLTVTTIGRWAFDSCPQLTTVDGCEHVKEIQDAAFNYCGKLSNFPFGDELQSIDNCFISCTSLPEKLVLPASVYSIGWAGTFSGSSIREFDLSQCNLTYSISQWMFGEATSVLLPEYGSYGVDLRTFEGSNITELIFPACVTYIGEYVVPSSVEHIYAKSATPINADSKAFYNVEPDICTLYVPVGSKNAYEEAKGWSYFENIQEQGIKVRISGLGSLMQGNITHTNGGILFANQGSATTLKLVPENDNKWIEVKLDGNALSIADDGTITIPKGTTIGTLDISFTNKMLTIDNLNGGELKDKITALGLTPSTIRAIKVVGKMTTKDWNYVKSNMSALEAFDISETDTKTIPEEAFRDHQRLTTINLPTTVTSIGNWAFSNCQQLTTVDGCVNVKEIGCYVFESCFKLTNFPFGNAIQSIEYNSFYNCSSLPETLVLSATLTTLGSDVFNRSSVTSFDLSQCTFTGCINQSAFGECTSLALPEKGGYCMSCNALKDAQITELRLPSSVNSLNCENTLPTTLETLYVSRIDPVWVDNNAFKNIDYDNCTLYVPLGSKEAYEVATGWSNFDNIKELGIKVNISGYGTVQQGNISYSDGNVFFATQGSATTLKLVPENDNEWIAVKLDGNDLNIADDGTFTIPKGTTVGTLDISFTSNLPTINNLNGGELKEKIAEISNDPSTIRGIKIVGTMTTKDWSFIKNNMTALEEFDISATDIKAIPEQAFENHQNLTTLHLPSTVTSIGSSAFWYCQQLTTVVGCENVKEIGNSAFGYCSKLTVFPFGDAIQKIESSAFENCGSLPATLVMPASLTSLSGRVFYGSSVLDFDLSQCTYTGTIWDNTFGECTSLLLPEKGEYYFDCNGLKDTHLTELRLPAAVNALYCEDLLPTTLERLYVSRTEPIYVNNNAFNNLDLDKCALYVPRGSSDAYAKADYWSAFTNVKEYGMTVVVGEQGIVRTDGQTLIGTTNFFPKGNTATFEIVPNAGWHADNVNLDGAKIPFANNIFTLSGDQLNGNLAVSFAANQFELQLQIAGNGKVKVGSQEYTTNQILTVDSLSTLNLTLEPAEGQMVSAITFNGEESVVQNGGKTYVTPAITAKSTLAITFGTSGATDNVVTYTVSTGEGGMVEYKNTTLLSPQTTILVPKGQDAVFEMKPEQYYVVDVVKLNNQDVTKELDANGKLTVKEVSADTKLEVTFRMNAEIAVDMETPGTLTNKLTDKMKQKVTKLIVRGPINEQDFTIMRDEMPLLAELDLWEAETEYIPYQAFCTSSDWSNPIGKRSLTSVRLPKETCRVGGWAFAGCSNLREVNFGELTQLEGLEGCTFAQTSLTLIDLSNTKLTEIGSDFYKVKNLEDIRLPKMLTRLSETFRESNLTEIDLSGCTNLKTLEYTFSECKYLVKVTLPEGLTTINGAFSGCEKLTTINFPKSLQVIGSSAFSNTKLQKVDLSGLTELQSIGSYAFSSCNELSEILFPSSLEQLGDYAFAWGYNKLTSIDLSETQLQMIPERAFAGCNNLESIKMPKTLEVIGSYAFEGCNKLSGNLELGSKINRIGDYAFASTPITIIRSGASVPPVLSENSMPETWVAAFVPKGCADAYLKADVWKDKSILDKEEYAEVTVTKEGNLGADINNQTGLLPGTITHLKVYGELGVQDFKILRTNMTLLYDLDLSDAEVTVIPANAFLDKKILMNVKLPASLRTIESGAFQGCSSLDGSLTLPDGLTFIGWGAFQGCSSLDEVVLNESLETIQGYAFQGCSSLKQEITLPRDFQSLGEHAFADCSSLYGTVKFNRDFYMFMGTEGYGSSTGYCFENCSSIESVDMSEPDFLDEIPYGTFANCTSLKTVLLPPNLERIDNNAFSNCSSLDGIEFPNTLLVINWGAFQNCTSLSSLNLSDCKDLGTIEGYAFNGCTSLETAYLPKSLNWIREYAFKDCRNLANITVEAVTPADVGDYVFQNVKTARCVLSIPTGTYENYLNAEGWGAFVAMRKSIDVTVGDGANLFIVNDEPAAARGARRAPTAEQQGAKVKDGSSLYVQENETATFKVNPDENVEIAKVLFNGKDVTSEVVNGIYETPNVTEASSFKVEVNVLGDLHVKELSLLDDNVTIKVAEKRQLRFAVYPTNATNQAITWTSSNDKVATVNSDGIITGVAEGNVEITGKTIDGGFEKKCQVVIKPNKYWLVTEEKVEEDIDRYVRLPLALHNEDEARAIQFDVWTPESMSMYTSEWDIELNSERANGYQVSTESVSNKVTRVKISSPTGSKFKDSDGEFITLSFSTGSKGGDLDLAIRNIHITGPNNFDFTAPDHTIRFSLPSYPMGDSNGDGKVTINDAVNTIDYLLGRPYERFYWSLTNVNKDGDITVADITGIIDILLERKSHASTARKTANNTQGRLYMNDFSMTAGKQQTIGLQMENAADFIAFQCDIYLPTGMEVARNENGKILVSLAGGVNSNHTISANLIDNGALRVIVMSPQNESLSVLENEILNLTVTTDATMVGDDVIDIRNIRLVRSSDHSEYLASDASASVHFQESTAIDKILATKGLKMRVEGHYLIVNATSATNLPLVSTNGVSRNLQIHKGENRFFIENAGVYIIGTNKLFIK